MNLSNHELFLQKKQLGPLLGVGSTKANFVLNVAIHEVGFTFCFSSKRTYEYISSQIPPSWQRSSPQRIKINFFEEDHFSDNAWGEEESSNCFLDYLDGKEMAIQRDFVGIENNCNHFNVVLGRDIHNGFYNSIRWILPRKLLSFNKIILHSSVIVSPFGRANFFLGHSGAGKTTIASLAKDRVVLGDDMNILSWSGDDYYVQAGGIGGRTDTSALVDNCYPVGAFYWIKQSEFTSIEPISCTEASLKFIASCPNLFLNYADEDLGVKIMKLAIAIGKRYPFKRLKFDLSSEFLQYVDE